MLCFSSGPSSAISFCNVSKIQRHVERMESQGVCFLVSSVAFVQVQFSFLDLSTHA